jgi:hypothetical protein
VTAVILRTRSSSSRNDVVRPFADVVAARAAWLAVVASGEVSYASVEAPAVPVRERYLCEWDKQGAFADRTAAHVEELRALCAELTREAPEGFTAAIDEDAVVFTGGADGPHRITCSCSDRGRVISHWAGYIPTVDEPQGQGCAS